MKIQKGSLKIPLNFRVEEDEDNYILILPGEFKFLENCYVEIELKKQFPISTREELLNDK